MESYLFISKLTFSSVHSDISPAVYLHCGHTEKLRICIVESYYPCWPLVAIQKFNQVIIYIPKVPQRFVHTGRSVNEALDISFANIRLVFEGSEPSARVMQVWALMTMSDKR